MEEPDLTEEMLKHEIMTHWRAHTEQGTACQFCTASVGHDCTAETMPHESGCIVRWILVQRQAAAD